MKLSQLVEAEKTITLNADDLRKDAQAEGQKMYGDSHTGLVFNGDIKVMTVKQYIGDGDDAGYDTYDYIFKPSGRDVADEPIQDSDAVDGVIYVAGANGIALLTLPGVKIKLSGDAKAKKDEGESGTIWKVTDKAGYVYYLGRPDSGKPLSSDKDTAWDQIKNQGYRGFSHHYVKIEPMTDADWKEYKNYYKD